MGRDKCMRHLVTVQQIEEIKPIEGADKIEAVRVKGWWVVNPKGMKIGDKILYFEIDSFLPLKPEYEFLLRGSSSKKMIVDGVERQGIKLKTIKLKGQLSQGLVMPIPTDLIIPEDGDVTEQLGVIKYEAPIPPELSGKAKGNFPSFIPKTDEERIQNMSDVLCNFYVTEKLDGSSVTYFKKDGVFGVCSRNLELLDNDGTQWKLARSLNLLEMPDNFALQGELVGEGIQKNPLKIKGHEVYFFNAYKIDAGRYLNFDDFVSLMSSLNLKTVPIVNDNFALPTNVDEMLLIAEGKSLLNPNSEREGIVVRPKNEMQFNGQRLSFKAISNKYLLGE